jgi:hypothetical protein
MSRAVSFAAECGAQMHGRSAAELTSTEVLDASHLSLPHVRETSTYLYSEPDARVLNQMTFACLGHPLRLTILSRQA